MPRQPFGVEEILRHLAEHDAPCPKCGYNLRGLSEAVCPECGRAVRLSDLPAQPRARVHDWLCVAGMAFTATVAGAWIVAVFQLASGPLDLLALWVPALLLVGLAMIAVVWATATRRIAARSNSFRWMNVTVCWTLGVFGALLLSLLLLGNH